MLKRKRSLFIFVLFLVFFVNIIFIPSISDNYYTIQDEKSLPRLAINQEGAENIILTYVNRRIDLDLYGLTKIRDILTVENRNNHPINSILVGIPLNHSNNLVFFESSSMTEESLVGENTLVTDRLNMIMYEFEMFAIYFDSPLLPYQSKTVIFRQVLKDLINANYVYDQTGQQQHYIDYKGLVFPISPYKMKGDLKSFIFFPAFGSGDEDITDDWGVFNPAINARTYEFEQISSEIGDDFIAPFLTNLNDYKKVHIWLKHQQSNKLEIEKLNREIFISPWGLIRVRENLILKNYGIQVSRTILFNIPKIADGLYISDDLGEILGVVTESNPGTDTQSVSINLAANRVAMLPNSSFSFNIEYYLPFTNYTSNNWFQDSININTITTNYDYLEKEQTIKITIDGCLKIDGISDTPDAIKKSQGMITLTFYYDYFTPGEDNKMQFTFTIDFFNLLLRPFIFIILILLIASLYIILSRTRKSKEDITAIKVQYIPINEIREYCSLNEEKNALILEIRQAEEDAKRKKMAKKIYKNILNKNNAKIDEIQKEIVPFKKVLIESGEVFENIVKKLDVLEAERISVKDSLALLESRYKRGRLPSRAAYLKLSDNFKKRTRKIDRTIDKLIQQLRSYLL